MSADVYLHMYAKFHMCLIIQAFNSTI